MSVLNENQKMGASGAGGEFEIEQSLRFEESRGSNLERTPAADSNRRTWTFSGWFKLGNLNARKVIFGARKSDTNPSQDYTSLYYESDGTFKLYSRIGNVTQLYCITNAKFRDPSAWYHIVAVIDTTQGTATNRAKLYVNNQLQSFSTATMPAQNYYTWVNNNFKHFIGSNPAYDNSTNHMYDGYMGEVNFIDGQALTPSSFGETGKYGEWKPIEVDGITYGTNGFYLPFKQDYTVEGFSTVVYEANTQVRYVGGTGFKPDFIWFKNRTRSSPHRLVDAVRGLPNMLMTNTSGVEATAAADGTLANTVTGFTADGFTLGIDDGGYRVNSANGDNIVAWSWDMGGTTASNTAGSITTSVRANTTYGQSIVSWTGNATNNTKLGHGLGSTPEIVIVKSRTTAAPWKVGGSVIQAVFGDGSNNSAFLSLNTNAGADQHTTGFQGNTATTIGVGADSDTNSNGATYIAYAFHSVTGYSKCGSYSGNGSTTGPTVALGFSPAFVIIKSMGVEHWKMYDNVRNPFNPVNTIVNANEADAEATSGNNTLNFTATGFQCTSTSGATNASGGKYIYMAFADTREYAYWLDQSGNNNDWTSEGGLTESDVMVDSPTNNFCTFNPLDTSGNITFSNGNLEAAQVSPSRSRGTIGSQVDGKIYFEFYNPRAISNSSVMHVGLNTMDANIHSASDFANSVGGAGVMTYFGGNDYWVQAHINGSAVGSVINVPGTKIGAGGIVSFAADSVTGKVWMAINNSWLKANGQFDGNNALSSSNYLYQLTAGLQWTPCTFPINFTELGLNCGADSSFGGRKTPQVNQDSNGIGDFYYAPPTGFLALCTANLPSVDVIPSENFNPVIYSGTGADNRVLSGVGFTPDLGIFKRRNGTGPSQFFDTLRGATKQLRSDSTSAESTQGNKQKTFTSDGYTLGTDAQINGSGGTYVAWNWKAGGATPSKTYAVTVVSDSGNKYRFDGFGTSAVTLNLQEGGTYKFDQSHSSNSGHPFRFGTSSNAYNYSTGVTTSGTPGNAGAYTQITLAANAPALYYSCSSHSGMGGAVNTNATSGSSNFNGSIVSTVSANVDAGFSIVTYSGASNATSDGSNNGGAYWRIGHSLAQAPEVVLVKTRSSQAAWYMGHQSLSATPWASGSHVQLNTTSASANESNILWGNAAPTSTVFAVGGWNVVNRANSTYLAYCFHSVEGYSKVGKYVGNGSATAGPFVHCGFKPAFVLIKRSSAAQDWYLWDTKTSPVNPVDATLSPNSSGAEGDRSSLPTDVLSNGFKIRNTSIGWNGSGDTYIFIAFAENPFKHSNAR